MVPRKTMQDELKKEEKELGDDITNLNKKVSPARWGLSRTLIIPHAGKVPRETI